MAAIGAFRTQGTGFVLPATSQPLGPYHRIDISHESLVRRWRRFQTWLTEEDLDVAELREWQQRASRRLEGGGWLDENDCDRASRWQARVNDRSHARLQAARYSGPGSYELVDDSILSSLERANQVRGEQEALKRDTEEARLKRFEIETLLQRKAAECAEPDKARAAKDRGRALAMAAVNLRRSRVSGTA